jgi:hypothetical protein
MSAQRPPDTLRKSSRMTKPKTPFRKQGDGAAKEELQLAPQQQ